MAGRVATLLVEYTAGGRKHQNIWENLNESLQGSISSASIFNYLNDMVDEGLIAYTEETR